METVAAPSALTQEHVERFRAFGFVVLRQWITPDEVATIQRDVAAAMDHAYRDEPFDGSRRHWLPMLGPACPTLAGFLEDPRFWDVAERLLDHEVVPLVADANRYTGDTPWHCDSQIGNQGTRYVMYLQPLTGDDGALRLIPGSHRPPLHDELERLRAAGHLADGPSVPAYAPAIEPGDVVVFNLPTWHAAFGGEPDRRMCTVNFFSLANDHDAIRRQMRQNAGMHRKAWGTRDGFPYFDPTWVENAGGSARRQTLIDRMRSLGLFDEAAAGEAEAASAPPPTAR